MSRPESSASSAGGTSTLRKPAPPKPKPLRSSHISLFLSNLRLLDFDLRDDWPDITVRTYNEKDVQHSQKKRIGCTEWALYRLFELWDPETTKDVR